jgi:2-polyprenyl-3-methyl-5-hydroxy-6-metoxy-1,4-benzoquinol methylase
LALEKTFLLRRNSVPDKLPKDMTMAERRALYSKHRNAPTTDSEARQLSRVQWLFREMPRIKPKSVLDIGCESGFVTRWMVDEPYMQALIGIDPCEFSIENAKKLIKKRAQHQKAFYTTVGWEDDVNQLLSQMTPGKTFANGAETIVCFEVIEHFLPDEGVELIRKIDSLLAPGGTAFLCTPDVKGRFGETNPDPWHLKLYGRAELTELVQDATESDPEIEPDPDFILLKWR